MGDYLAAFQASEEDLRKALASSYEEFLVRWERTTRRVPPRSAKRGSLEQKLLKAFGPRRQIYFEARIRETYFSLVEKWLISDKRIFDAMTIMSAYSPVVIRGVSNRDFMSLLTYLESEGRRKVLGGEGEVARILDSRIARRLAPNTFRDLAFLLLVVCSLTTAFAAVQIQSFAFLGVPDGILPNPIQTYWRLSEGRLLSYGSGKNVGLIDRFLEEPILSAVEAKGGFHFSRHSANRRSAPSKKIPKRDRDIVAIVTLLQIRDTASSYLNARTGYERRAGSRSEPAIDGGFDAFKWAREFLGQHRLEV